MLRKAVILAAGRGTRVQPLTYDMPKPMVPLLGKPVMEYIVEHLARQGIEEIIINVSHLAWRIEQYFGDGRRFGVRIGYSFEGHLDGPHLIPEPVGSAGALRKIQDFGGFIDETTVVLCGDAVVDLDLQAAARRHREMGAMASVVTREVPLKEVCNYGIVVSDPNGRITSFQEKPDADAALSRQASTGIYLVEPAVLNLIPRNTVYDIGSELFPDLVQRDLPFYSQCQDFQWLDIGRVGDYWRITQQLLAGELSGFPMPGRELRPGVWVGLNTHIDWDHVHLEGPVYVGSGTRIEAGARIVGPTWIGAGCRIGRDTLIERSVLFDYTELNAGATARELIVSGRYCVNRDGLPPQSGDGQASLNWWRDARVLEEGMARRRAA